MARGQAPSPQKTGCSLTTIQNDRRPQLVPAESAHLVEFPVADRQMLAVHGLAMLAVIHIGIMQVDEFVVAIDRKSTRLNSSH